MYFADVIISVKASSVVFSHLFVRLLIISPAHKQSRAAAEKKILY